MIDKKISFFWGNTPMSWMRYLTLYSFRKMNPDWEINLYTSESTTLHKVWQQQNVQDFFNYSGEDYSNRVGELGVNVIPWNPESVDGRPWTEISPSQKSNFFKWWLLANYSGYYADLDILFIKPVDAFYESTKDYDTIICYCGYFSIGFMASSGNNQMFDDIYKNGFKCFNSAFYQTAGVENIYNLLGNFTSGIDYWSVLEQRYPNSKKCNHGMDLVCPFDSYRIDCIFNQLFTEVPERCIGIHWYAGSPISQSYNNVLNEQNYMSYANTFSHFLGRVMKG